MIYNLLIAALFPVCLTGSCVGNRVHPTEGGAKQESVAQGIAQSHPEQHPKEKENDVLQQTLYTQADSARVEALLRENPGENDVLFYARKFIGVPYVAATLEKSDPEQLVVNLRQMDCTTLVETTLALTLTKRQQQTHFVDYCRNLMALRYWHGKMDGYLSRLHYFTWWMHDNINKQLVEEVKDPAHFTTPITIKNAYMTTHPDKYKFLKQHPEWVDSIAVLERKYNGADGCYLSETQTALPKQKLRSIQSGDIIAIVTKKAGIDYSHLGFAVWGKDNRLHLLNASFIHHKVVEEPKTLRQYLKEHPSSVGIRVLRLRK